MNDVVQCDVISSLHNELFRGKSHKELGAAEKQNYVLPRINCSCEEWIFVEDFSSPRENFISKQILCPNQELPGSFQKP